MKTLINSLSYQDALKQDGSYCCIRGSWCGNVIIVINSAGFYPMNAWDGKYSNLIKIDNSNWDGKFRELISGSFRKIVDLIPL